MCNTKLGRGTLTPFAQTPRQMWHHGTSSQLPSENSCRRGYKIGQSVLFKEGSTWVAKGTMHPQTPPLVGSRLKKRQPEWGTHQPDLFCAQARLPQGEIWSWWGGERAGSMQRLSEAKIGSKPVRFGYSSNLNHLHILLRSESIWCLYFYEKQ